jgi:predicted TIM-barrel fold metal-dependent hydrolase
MMIWDLHCHLSGVTGRTPDERMAELVELADRMGIERLCIYMGYPFIENPTPEQFRQQNDMVIQAISHWHHRAFGFVYLNPRYEADSLAELDRCVRDGPMVGVKLWIAMQCNAPQFDSIIQRATELKALVFQHTWIKSDGNRPGESTPEELAELAQRGNWERGIRAVRALKNVSVDLAGSDPTAGMTEMAVRELGAERVLYGSDAGGRSFASQLAKVHGARIPEAAKRLLFGENLKRLLQPITTAKGLSV